MKYFITLIMLCSYACSFASNNTAKLITFIIDGESQPPLVGAEISDINEADIIKRGFIVSDQEFYPSLDYAVSSVQSQSNSYGWTDKPVTTKPYDCSQFVGKQYSTRLIWLQSATTYNVRAYLTTATDTIYGNAVTLTSQTYKRYNGYQGYGNVYYAFSNQLFCFMSDEMIDPGTDGFYYSTNEAPKTCRYQKGTSRNLCYKFKTEWNYRIWLYRDSPVKVGLTTMPTMSMSDNSLVLSAETDCTIFYSINGNGLRPEEFTDKYNAPIEVNKGDVVYCYAIKNDIPSEVNVYMVQEETKAPSQKYVDLALPSGTLWATCNIGASTPQEYGEYLAWGETKPKTNYSWSTYFDTSDNGISFNRYYNDGITVLQAVDDAATVNWGKEWRMPTAEELKELMEECTWQWTKMNNVNGCNVIGPNGNFIFLPAAGFHLNTGTGDISYYGNYWSSSINDLDSSDAHNIYFGKNTVVWNHLDMYGRYIGRSVRPVYINKEAQTDNMNDLITSNKKTITIYTIHGQRVNNTLRKGIYIVNGRKAVIK